MTNIKTTSLWPHKDTSGEQQRLKEFNQEVFMWDPGAMEMG